MKISLKKDYNYLAPDGSEIRLLAKVNAVGICHCTLPVSKTSAAVKHKTVEEIWYFISGEGEMWQKEENDGLPVPVKKGDSVNIPKGNSFQFRNLGKEPLCIIITTIPNWPGAGEVISVAGYWKELFF
ncbi:MAG: cupin domain-containing protein [Saprospiraceae bacterium]|nr:cupin domain-containing protein [Saprospiraceae bacterium]